jgi:two-component system OmpR family sensor kinase
MGEPGPQRVGRFLSVRSRILASILLVAALGLAGAGVVTFLVQRDRVLTSVDDRLTSRVESARFVVTGDRNDFATTSSALEAVIARIIPTGGESSLGIVDGVATYVPGVQLDFHLEKMPALVSRIVKETADGSSRLGTYVGHGYHVRYIAIPVTVAGSASGVYVAAIDLDAELEELASAFTTYTVVAVVALLAIGLVGWFVAGRLLRPLRDLRSAANRITASDRLERIPVRGRDDISALTTTINDMLDRLDGAMTAQRQLLDDVRHELATPITIVRGHLELLDSGNATEVDSTRAIALDELDRMSGLVADIESLAETAPATRTQVDAAEFTAEVFAKVSVIAGHSWVLGDAARAVVAIDSARITQAWLQLCDNAAKYSSPGSAVTIGSSAVDDGIEFWVADEGPGIPTDAQARVFERFGRVDTGRGIRGSGLGLAIVAAITATHGGRVTLASSSNGSRFGIVVPHEGEAS